MSSSTSTWVRPPRYDKHQPSAGSNSRNGKTKKALQTDAGPIELETPRDRDGSFEPQLVKKKQRRFTSMDERILFLYAKGMTTRDIFSTFKEMYGADVSPTLISKATNAVLEQVIEWLGSPAGSCLPHRLPRLHRGENPPRQASDQQGRLPGAGRGP